MSLRRTKQQRRRADRSGTERNKTPRSANSQHFYPQLIHNSVETTVMAQKYIVLIYYVVLYHVFCSVYLKGVHVENITFF